MITSDQIVKSAQEALAELLTEEKIEEIKAEYEGVVVGVKGFVSKLEAEFAEVPDCTLKEQATNSLKKISPEKIENKIIGMTALTAVALDDAMFENVILNLVSDQGSLSDLTVDFKGIKNLHQKGFTTEEIAHRHNLPFSDVEEYLGKLK